MRTRKLGEGSVPRNAPSRFMVSDGIGNRLVWNLLSCLSGEEAVAYRLQAEPDSAVAGNPC